MIEKSCYLCSPLGDYFARSSHQSRLGFPGYLTGYKMPMLDVFLPRSRPFGDQHLQYAGVS